MDMDLITEQKLVCEEYGSKYLAVNDEDMIAVAVDSLKQDPIVGIRNQPEAGDEVSWFIYAGEHDDREDFFQTVAVKDLHKLLPEVLPYLALDHGYRFMIDREEYEDVWKEGDEI
ncbi:immunity protein Imm33 domain-containing protein [Acinetobacter sp. GXMZU3951]